MEIYRSTVFLLVLSHVATDDQCIKIILTPRDYVEPCDEEGFICGVDKNIDSERLIAEQNSDFIFHFLDKTTDIGPNYKTTVFAVSVPNNSGQLVTLSDGTENGPDPGLLSLFLTPSKNRCNKLTFEDANAEKDRYYPIFIGYQTNWTEQISKFESDSEKLKILFNGKTPNLCASFTKMEAESGQARVATLTQLFNFLYNSGRNDLSPTEDCCKTKTDTKEAFLQSGFFETSQTISLETTSISTSEADGFARVDLYRNKTGTKQIVFIDTEFATGNGSAADANDIVPYNFPVVFAKTANTTSVIVRIKADLDDEEEDEYFKIKISSGMKRRKRDLLAYEVLVTILKKVKKEKVGEGNYLHTPPMSKSHIQGLCRLWLAYHYLIVNLAQATGQAKLASEEIEYLKQKREPHCKDDKWVEENAVRFYTDTGPSSTANSDGMKETVKEERFKDFFKKLKGLDKMSQSISWDDFEEISKLLISDTQVESLLKDMKKKSDWISQVQETHKDVNDTKLKSLLKKLLHYKQQRIFAYMRSAALQIWLLNNKGQRHDNSGDVLYRSKEFDQFEFKLFQKQIGESDIGDVIQINDFTSTSTVPRARDDERNIFWTFQECQDHGASVKALSPFPEEEEVLLPAGECYALVSYKREEVSYQKNPGDKKKTKKNTQEVVYSCIKCP